MSILRFAATLVCVVATASFAVDATTATLCPFGWKHYPPADQCYRFWGSEGFNSSYVVRRTYDEASEVCARYDAEIPIVTNATQMTFIMDLVGRNSGRQVWTQPREDPVRSRNGTKFWTQYGHPFTEFFDWDHRRNMPGPESCIALQAAGNPSRRIVGGNNKMITVDCFERLGTLCVKQRRPMHVGGVNMTSDGTVDHIWNRELILRFIGSRIPHGTRVTLQTTDDSYFATAPPRYPTNCTFIRPLHGAASPVTLNVTSRPWSHRLCNGTCDEATLVLPASTPFVRGARYSFCFFKPIPFAEPKSEREYGLNLLPRVWLEVIQARDEYLRDVCVRHQASVEGFVQGKSDLDRDIVRPYFFDSRHV
jgi:hypothetical protein